MFSKKSIRIFGKIYEYLKNADLRLEEVGRQRLLIKDADFDGEKFDDAWGYCDFVNCDFTGAYSINLGQLADCSFTDCNFRGIFGFGGSRNTRFFRCKATGASYLAFDPDTTNLVFEECEFLNSNNDPNHRGAVGYGEIMFVGGKAKNFALLSTKSLTLRRFIAGQVRLGTPTSGTTDKPYSDFLLEDCDFRGGVYAIDGELNDFTLRHCKVKVFALYGADVLGDALFEGIQEGYLIAAAAFKGRLTIRDCTFSGAEEKEYGLELSGDVPVHTLLENVTVNSRKPVDAIQQRKPVEKWDDPPPNKSFIIKNCKIPHLKIDWAQTEHLRIENCKFDYLDIKNGRIGRLEIIGCSLRKLDVSNTQVKTHDVRVPEGGKISGHVTVTTGSNIKLPRE